MASEYRSLPLDADLRDDARGVLCDAARWKLTAAQWSAAREALDDMRSAVDVGDGAAMQDAVYRLELAGPVRAVPTDGPKVGDPPEPVRDLINELVHDLSGEEADETVEDQP